VAYSTQNQALETPGNILPGAADRYAAPVTAPAANPLLHSGNSNLIRLLADTWAYLEGVQFVTAQKPSLRTVRKRWQSLNSKQVPAKAVSLYREM